MCLLSQWVSFLHLISNMLSVHGGGIPHRTLHGGLTIRERRTLVDWLASNDPEQPPTFEEDVDDSASQLSDSESGPTKEFGRVLLVSLKAGGVGLNLTAASSVYMMDLWWNPAVEDQAMQRVHRIGQTQKVKIKKNRGTLFILIPKLSWVTTNQFLMTNSNL